METPARAKAVGPGPIGLIAVVAALTFVALWPAIWNGYPLVFDDSGLYVLGSNDPGYPPFYGKVVAWASLDRSLFIPVVLQAVGAVAVATLFLAGIGRIGSSAALLATGALVLCANQLPWLASLLMPDVLAGLGAAAVILTLAGEPLPWPWRIFLHGVVFAAALAATANIPLLCGLAAAIVGLHLMLMRRLPPLAPLLANIGTLAGAVALVVLVNLATFGRPALNSGSAVHTFSRLVDIGLAQPVTMDACRTRRYAVCAHLPELKRAVRGQHDFQWDGLAERTHAYGANREEYAELNRLIIARRAPEIIIEGLRDAGVLFLRPALGDRQRKLLTPYPPEAAHVHRPIAMRDRAHLRAFETARQQSGELIRRFPGRFYAVSTYASYAALVVLIGLSWTRGDRRAAIVGLAVVATVVGELVIHGTLIGGPFPRHHVKVGWLGWLVCAALAARLAGAARRVAASPQAP